MISSQWSCDELTFGAAVVEEGEVAYHKESGEEHAHQEAPLAGVRHGGRVAVRRKPLGRTKHQPKKRTKHQPMKRWHVQYYVQLNASLR